MPLCADRCRLDRPVHHYPSRRQDNRATGGAALNLSVAMTDYSIFGSALPSDDNHRLALWRTLKIRMGRSAAASIPRMGKTTWALSGGSTRAGVVPPHAYSQFPHIVGPHDGGTFCPVEQLSV